MNAENATEPIQLRSALKALFALATAIPDAFVWNSVGNLYQL